MERMSTSIELLGLSLLAIGIGSESLDPVDLAEGQDGKCKLSEADTHWPRDSVVAWEYAAREFLRIEPSPSPIAIFFDSRCVRSTDQLHLDGREQQWDLSPHAGEARHHSEARSCVACTSSSSFPAENPRSWNQRTTPPESTSSTRILRPCSFPVSSTISRASDP